MKGLEFDSTVVKGRPCRVTWFEKVMTTEAELVRGMAELMAARNSKGTTCILLLILTDREQPWQDRLGEGCLFRQAQNGQTESIRETYLRHQTRPSQ